jgi:hypothetical protein
MAELSGPCCACRSVSYRTECGIPAHPGTVTAWWWECDICERRFLPESEVDALLGMERDRLAGELEAERVRGVLWEGAARGWRDRTEAAEGGPEAGPRPGWLERVAQDVEGKTRDRPSWRRSRSVNEDLARLEAGEDPSDA